jgi:hypothetical protein
MTSKKVTAFRHFPERAIFIYSTISRNAKAYFCAGTGCTQRSLAAVDKIYARWILKQLLLLFESIGEFGGGCVVVTVDIR